jgi:hypothetical protein
MPVTGEIGHTRRIVEVVFPQFIRYQGSSDLYRMLSSTANGQPAAAAHRRGDDGSYAAFALVVLSTTTTGIARIALFNDPRSFATFGLPASRPAGAPRFRADAPG